MKQSCRAVRWQTGRGVDFREAACPATGVHPHTRRRRKRFLLYGAEKDPATETQPSGTASCRMLPRTRGPKDTPAPRFNRRQRAEEPSRLDGFPDLSAAQARSIDRFRGFKSEKSFAAAVCVCLHTGRWACDLVKIDPPTPASCAAAHCAAPCVEELSGLSGLGLSEKRTQTGVAEAPVCGVDVG
jgi:hypothetical protein